MEKDILLLYNPRAGDTFFRFELEKFLDVFGNTGRTIRIYKSTAEGDMGNCIRRTDLEEIDLIIVAGGDGSVNDVIQAVMEQEIRPQIGIIPAGTSNEMARYLELPEHYSQCIDVLVQRKTEEVNVGEVNGHFFINRCGFGNMMDVFQSTSQALKNTLGPAAYYLNAIRKRKQVESFHLKVQAGETIVEDDFILILVINSKEARLFRKEFSTEVSNPDQLTFVGIRNGSRLANRRMLLKSFLKVPVSSKKIVLLQGDEIEITGEAVSDQMNQCYVDGEAACPLPLHFTLHRRALQILTNREGTEDVIQDSIVLSAEQNDTESL